MNILSTETQSYIADSVFRDAPADQKLDIVKPNRTGERDFDEQDFGWTATIERDGRQVVMSYTNPNIREDIGETLSSLGIYGRFADGTTVTEKVWSVTSSTFRETTTVYVDYFDMHFDRKERISADPNRTYKALSRLARIHMNHLAAR